MKRILSHRQYVSSDNELKEFIKNEISQNKNKIRVLGSGYGKKLYQNIFSKGDSNTNFIQLPVSNELKVPIIESADNSLNCHPNHTISECFEEGLKSKRMILGTPMFNPISIGGAINVGGVGSHILSESISSQISKLWIIDGTQKEHEIEGDELRYFRGTLGYLGIIWKIQLKTTEAKEFQMSITSHYENNISKFPSSPAHICQMFSHDKFKFFEIKDIGPAQNGLFTSTEMNAQIKQKEQNFKENASKNIESIFDANVPIGAWGDFSFPNSSTKANSNEISFMANNIENAVIAMTHSNISLECGIYFCASDFEKGFNIFKKHYSKWRDPKFFSESERKFCFLTDVLVRKVYSSSLCPYDATYSERPIMLYFMDFGMVKLGNLTDFKTDTPKNLVDDCIKELIDEKVIHGFHMGKYVNDDIIKFMKNSYISRNSNLLEDLQRKKNYYDPEKRFSNESLESLYFPTGIKNRL